jgi:hypothetical protein
MHAILVDENATRQLKLIEPHKTNACETSAMWHVSCNIKLGCVNGTYHCDCDAKRATCGEHVLAHIGTPEWQVHCQKSLSATEAAHRSD